MIRSWQSFLIVVALLLGISAWAVAEEATESATGQADAGTSAQEKARRSRVLAKVNGKVITVGDFEDRLNKQGPFRRVQYSAPEKRREFLQQMIDWELQAQEAERRGLGNDPAAREQLRRVMSSLLLRREVDERVRPEDVSEEEMRQYYEDNYSTFHRPEVVRAYHIVISDHEKAQKLLKRILDEKADTREFRRLARELSEDPVTKRRGGDLRYFPRVAERGENDAKIPEPVVKAAFELLSKRRALLAKAEKASKGRPSPPSQSVEGFNPIYPKLVKSSQGYHIVRFAGHREAVDRPFEEVKRQIRNRLWRSKLQKARESFVEGLRNRFKVRVNEDNLKLVKVDTTPRVGGPVSPLRPAKRSGRPRLGGHEGAPGGQQDRNEH